MTKYNFLFLVPLLGVLFYNHGYYVLEDNPQYIKTLKINEGPYQGIITYLVNLDRSSDRLKFITPKIKKLALPFKRISAIDGNSLSDNEIKQKFHLSEFLKLWGFFESVGGFGCSLSHIKTWKTFLKSNYEFALILEDDAQFDPKSLSTVINQLLENQQYWDIVTFDPQRKGTPLIIKNLRDNNLVVYLGSTYSTTAYLITRKTAEKFLLKSTSMKLPLDRYFNRAWEFNIKFAGITPRLVTQSNKMPSQIRISPVAKVANDAYLKSRWFYFLSSEFFKLQTKIIRALYNFKIFILSSSCLQP